MSVAAVRAFVRMESGAILVYLAERTGRLMPGGGEGGWRVQ